MNRKQKLVIGLAVAAMIVTLIFPPHLPRRPYQDTDYFPVFGEDDQRITVTRFQEGPVHVTLLLAWWAAGGIVATGGILIFADKKDKAA